MSIQLESYFDADQSLIGQVNYVQINSITASNALLDTAFLLSQSAIDIGRTDIIEVRLPNNTVFQIPSYEWAKIDQTLAGSNLANVAPTRRHQVLDEDGNTSVYFGRTPTNQVLFQSIDWEYDNAQAFLASLYSLEYHGGFLDHRIGSVGTRHTIAMQARNATRPDAPGSGVDYNGRYVETETVGGVSWYTLNFNLTGSETLWFAFGEAVYNQSTGRWEVQDNWVVVDTTDTTNVNFAPTSEGTWTSPYIHNTHNYARIRRADGSFTIRNLLPTSQTLEREWQLLSETYISGSEYRAEPYTTRLFFDFHPDEFRLMKVSFDWENYSDTTNGVLHYDRTTGFIDPSDIVCAPEGDRLSSRWDTKTHGPTWRWQFVRDGAAYLSRFADDISGGAAHDLTMQVQFEANNSTGDLPIEVFRVMERTVGSRSVTGWLRIWVL